MVGVVAIPVVILIAIFATDWTSGIIALACYPVTVLYMVMLGETAQDRATRRHAEFMLLSDHFIITARHRDPAPLRPQLARTPAYIFSVSERFRKASMKTIAVAVPLLRRA